MRRLTAFLVLVLLSIVTTAEAARLFVSGFETANLAATEWTGTGGAVVTTAPHAGTYHGEFINSTNGPVRALHANYTSGTLYFRLYFRIASSASADRAILEVRNSSNTVAASFSYIESSNTVQLTNAVTTSNTATSATFDLNTWYRAELRYLLSDTVGELELRLYTGESTTATETLSITGEDTLATNVGNIRLTPAVASSATVYIDDVGINDESGSFQVSWLGPGKVAMLVPNADTSVAWTDATGTETGNWGEVNDEPGAPDDDTSYVTSSTANQEDRYGLTDMPAEVPSDAVITLAAVYARIRGEGTTSTRQVRVLIWDEAGAQTNGPTTNDNDNTSYQVFATNEQLVFDTAGKTKSNLDSFDAGAEPLTNHATRLTALWVNVEWTEAAAAATCKRPLMGVGC